MRLSKTKMSHECETLKVKVLAIKDNFKGVCQKILKKSRVWREKKEIAIKEEYIEKVGKHLNIYAKQSDLT